MEATVDGGLIPVAEGEPATGCGDELTNFEEFRSVVLAYRDAGGVERRHQLPTHPTVKNLFTIEKVTVDPKRLAYFVMLQSYDLEYVTGNGFVVHQIRDAGFLDLVINPYGEGLPGHLLRLSRRERHPYRGHAL